MPKLTPPEAFDDILEAFSRLPSGASVEQISNALRIPSPRRTLQRRLSQLVREGQLGKEGVGRATRYRLVKIPEKPSTLESNDHAHIDVSKEGEAIRKAVRIPLQQRAPVGYDQSFLEQYHPNDTFYLSQSLREHLANTGKSSAEEMPAGTYARQILDRLLIDLSWNSSRLEGNTYSLLETERLLKLGKTAEDKDAKETQMILNHKAAIELLVDNAAEIGFNRYTILNLHALLANNLLSDPQAGGRLRSISVGIGGTVFQPLSNPQLIEECFNQILAKATAIEDPFEQAFFAMVQLPYLQPFEDVNKRVSRLAANIPLIRHNLSPLSFVDVPERDYVDAILGIYEVNRVELLRDVFRWAYERSSRRYAAVRQSLGQPDRFRLAHRQLLQDIINEVVRAGMDRTDAIAFIRREAANKLPSEDIKRFVEIAETEILSLHEGNFARYRLRPSEYESWRAKWQ